MFRSQKLFCKASTGLFAFFN